MNQTSPTYVAFAALALLLGPLASAAADPLATAMRFQPLAGTAITSALAGSVLLIFALLCKQRPAPLLPLLLLAFPHWLTLLLSAVPALHQPPWAVPLFFAVAAPLWLGLLAAAQIIALDPPRTAIAASIAGLAAVCLIVSTDAYTPAASQMLATALHLALAILTVGTWAFAARRLKGAKILPTAASFLLLNAAGTSLLWFLLERVTWQPLSWSSATVPILAQAALLAASSPLWFVLLRRLPLAAFSMHPLAAWTASVLSGLVFFGLRNLRADTAFLLALAAVLAALHAPPADEQPVTLGLHTP